MSRNSLPTIRRRPEGAVRRLTSDSFDPHDFPKPVKRIMLAFGILTVVAIVFEFAYQVGLAISRNGWFV